VVAAINPYTSGELCGSIERAIIWLEEGMDVHIIDLGKIRGAEKTNSILPEPSRKIDTRRLDREIKSIVEVSSNTHDDVIHRVMATKVPKDMDFIRGEGINRTFGTVREAAEYAYHIRALAQMIKWEDMDLPADTQLQITIHTGLHIPNGTSDRAARDSRPA